MLSMAMTTARILPLLFAMLAYATPQALARDGTPITCTKLTAVDGDTIKCDGVNMRDMGDGAPFVSGYDTPEIQHHKCPAELVLAHAAKKKMSELLKTPGIEVYDSGQVDARWHRPLVWVILGDGRSVGSVLIKDGLAKVWTPEYRGEWCN